MTVWKSPYPDVSVDIRRPDRTAADQPEARRQAARLARIAPRALAAPLEDRLLGRRRAGRSDILQLEVADVDDGGRTLVVRDQVLLRRASAGDEPGPAGDGGPSVAWRSSARTVTGSASLEPIEGAVDAGLAGRLDVYRMPDAAASDRRSRIDHDLAAPLLDQGVTASLPAVLVLQRPPGGSIVIKSPGGPAKTAVDLPARLAGTPTGGVRVAVIDTGITAELRSADSLLNEVPRHDAPAPRVNIDALDVFEPVGPSPQERILDFGAGHGTFVAGIVRQVDPDAEILVYRATDSDGFGSEVDLAQAILRAAGDGAHVINLSLGTHTVDDKPLSAVEAALDVLAAIPADRRPVVVAAAGNAGSTRRVWPAASDRVVGVAGLTSDGLAEWSSRGKWVDFSAIGEGVVSTYVQGIEDPEFGGDEVFGPDAWALWTGTSFAAPQIAGAIARTCREQSLSPVEAVDWLRGHPDVTDRRAAGYGAAMMLLPGT